MKLILRTVLVVALIALASGMWGLLFPSPEKVIRQRLAEVARDVSFGPDENPLALANRAGNLLALFSTNVEVNIDVPEHRQTFEGRDELMQAAAGAHASTSRLKVEFLDMTVTVAPDKQSATASAVVKVETAGNKDNVMQPLKFSLQKSGRDWLVTRVDTLRTLN